MAISQGRFFAGRDDDDIQSEGNSSGCALGAIAPRTDVHIEVNALTYDFKRRNTTVEVE